jgi:hypothetical protein
VVIIPGDDIGFPSVPENLRQAVIEPSAVGVAGHQPDLVGRNPEPFPDDPREARLVALPRRHRPQDDLHDVRGVDHDLGPPTRRAGVELDRSGGADAAAQAATARFRPYAREKPADVGVLERGVIP